MIWKTTNALGQEVTWYSAGEYLALVHTLDDVRELLELHANFNGTDTHLDRAISRIDREIGYIRG